MKGNEACCRYYIEGPCHVGDFELAKDVVKGAAYELAIIKN